MLGFLKPGVTRVKRTFARKRFKSFRKKSNVTQIGQEYSPSWVHSHAAQDLSPRNAFDPSDVTGWQSKSRKKLRELLKIPSFPINAAPEEVWTATDDRGIYKKVLLLGEYESRIPIYVCSPRSTETEQGTVICLQGHTSGMHNSLGVRLDHEEHALNVPVGRDLVNWCFANNFSAVCLEQRCFGERSERIQKKRSPHPCHDTAMRALLLGRTLMGERIADLEVCIRYIQGNCALQSPIGIVGNSLGGTLAVYALAVLDDVQFSVAGSCTSTLDKSIGNIYHCTDLYIPQLREFFEFSDIVGLAAPKPLILVQGINDPIFPYDGLKEVEAEVGRIYDLLGASDRFIVKVGQGGHRFYPDLASQGLSEIFNSAHQF